MSHHTVLIIVVVAVIGWAGNDEVCCPNQFQLDQLDVRDQWEPFRGSIAIGVRSNAHFTGVGCVEQDESLLIVDVCMRERLIRTEIIGVIRRRRHVLNPEENDLVYRMRKVLRVEEKKNERLKRKVREIRPIQLNPRRDLNLSLSETFSRQNGMRMAEIVEMNER